MASEVLGSPGTGSPGESVDYDDYKEQYTNNARRRANFNFINSMDSDPEEAARAVALSNDSGVPASLINSDLPTFEKQHRAALSTDVIGRNRRLQEYLEDPTAAQMSHDDIGPLDQASRSLEKVTEKSKLSQWLDDNSIQRSFMRGFGEEPFDTEKFYHGYSSSRPNEIEWAASHPVEGAVYGAAGQALGLGELGMQGLSRTISGLMSLGYDGMSEAFGEPFARDIMGIAEMSMMRGDIGVPGAGGGLELGRAVRDRIAAAGLTPEKMGEILEKVPSKDEVLPSEERGKAANDLIVKNADKLRQLFHGLEVSDIYTGAGEEPPPHVDPLIDKAKEVQIREDLDRLKQAMQDSDATATKERSPDYYARFAELHGEGEIGIDSETLRNLYGDKVPAEGDGLLGWIPDLAKRLENAETHGGDIYVPRSDFLARTERAVVNEIGDGLRLRDGGLTVDETKIDAEPKQVIADPVAATRGAAGMEPLAMAGDRKVTLQRGEGAVYIPGLNQFHTIKIFDDTGKEIGGIGVSTQKYGKHIHIDYIQAGTEANQFYQPNFLGYSLVKDIKRQLKAMFPEVETFTGERVTGGRLKAAGESGALAPTPTVKLDLDGDPQPFRDMLGEMWQEVYPNVEALFETPEGGDAANSPMGRIVLQELRRLVPGIAADVAQELRFTHLPDSYIRGAFLPDTEAIIVALGHEDPIGTAKHEAIHGLRRLGLLTETEWSQLQTESIKSGWREQFGIDERYAHASELVRNEEAVAEAFRHWSAGKLEVADPTLFQRIKDFLDGVKKQVLDHLGIERDLSWDEIFAQVEKGEVGRREAGAEGAPREALAMVEGEPPVETTVKERLESIKAPPGITSALFKPIVDRLVSTVGGVKLTVLNKRMQHERYGEIRGAYYPGTDEIKIAHHDYEGTMVHEAVHAATYKAIEENAVVRGNVETLMSAIRYEEGGAFTPMHPALYAMESPHEFMAEALSNSRFQEYLAKTKLDPQFQARLRLPDTVKNIWQAVIEQIRGILNLPKESMSALEAIMRVADVAISEERPAAKGKSRAALASTGDLGREVPSEKEKRLIKKRNDEDYEATLRRQARKETKLGTPAAKTRLEQIKDEVSQDLRSHPTFAADKLMTDQKFKIDPKHLTEEQRGRLPKDYQAKGGVNPDDVAPVLGFKSGDALVERLAMVTEERNRLGLSQKEYFDKTRDIEVDRRMSNEFGDSQKTTLEEARDQALSETQMQLNHEETMNGARATGIDPQLKLENMKAIAKKVFDEIPLKEIKSSRYLQKAGTMALRIAEAKAKGQNQKVYQLLQQRQLLQLIAKEARAYEKARASFDKTANFFSKTPTEETAKRIDIAYYNWVQEILARLGQPLKRTIGELNAAIQMEDHQTLQDFAQAKRNEFRELNIPDYVLDPMWPGSKTINHLTHKEFMDIHDMVKSMEYEGRNERYLVLQGREIPVEEAREQMIQQIKETVALEPKTRERPGRVAETAKGLWWGHITPEAMWDRLDRGNVRGLFHQLLIYPAARAINAEKAMMDKYKGKFQELRSAFKDMDKSVENTIFKDPNTGTFMPMRRRNVLGVLAYWGNNSNILKLTEGWGVKPDAVNDFLRRNTTREDWDNMQKVGDLFEEVFKEAEKMSHEVTGVGIKRVQIEPFTDPFGVPRRGWYSPVDYDPYLPGKSQLGKDALERPGFYRATTDQRYTKARTGYIAPTALDLDIIPQRFAQIIHDTAVRPALIDMGKILYNTGVQRAIIAGYGKAQMEEMKSWMQDFANRRNVDSAGQKAMNDTMGFLRANIIGNLIGLNPSTILKHTPTALVGSMAQVGPFSFMKATLEMFRTDPATQMRIMQQVYQESKEIQGRMHNYADLLRGQGEDFKFEQGTLSWLRELNLKMGAAPVSFGDYLSVSPTYWAARTKALRQGSSIEEAIDIGDAAVRAAHGTFRLTGQPGVMRTNELGRMYTSLYGFFSHILQQQYKLAWKSRDLLNGQKPLDIEGHWAPHMIGKYMSYFIIPAIIEELVTPYTNEEKDSWAMKAGKGLAMGLSSSLTQVRDIVRSLINPQQRAGGLLDTAFDFPKNVAKDLSGPMNKEHAAKLIKDAIGTIGALTGLTNATEGRMAEYIYRYSQGLERPKGPWDVGVGLRYGKTDRHSRTFEEWWKHTVEGKR
jgi:hypothetical protein